MLYGLICSLRRHIKPNVIIGTHIKSYWAIGTYRESDINPIDLYRAIKSHRVSQGDIGTVRWHLVHMI